MIKKTRSETEELLVLRSLIARAKLPESELNHYRSLEKGYEGEKHFDKLIESLQGEFIGLFDLLFEVNNTIFQIDTLLLSADNIYLFEVKNYEGDYYIDSENRWYSTSNIEIKNPIHQLNRCETLLKRLLQNIGYNASIEANLIFINPEFSLYQAPLNLPLVFPTQLNRHLNQLGLNLSQLKLKDRNHKLAEKLLSCHLEESPYIRKPEYNYEQLKKGIYCKTCHSFNIYSNSKTIICNECGFRENVEAAVIRAIEEIKILFPELKITTSRIHDWCKIIKSDSTIRRILSINHKSIGSHRGSYYIDK